MSVNFIETWQLLQSALVDLHPWRIFFIAYMIAQTLEIFYYTWLCSAIKKISQIDVKL